MSRHAYWIASLLFSVLVLAKFNPQTGFTALIRFGETGQDHRLAALQNLPVAVARDSNGYDGQFYAQLALDPLLQRPDLSIALDAPAYRARRILVPAVAALVGLGQPWWILQAYASLNVVCWFALGHLLRHIIGGAGWVAFARWAGCMFGIGALDSVRQSLVDLPAMLLLAAAVEAHRQAKNGRSTLWLALGNLTKETSLLGAFALHAEKPGRGQGRRTLLHLGLSTVPLLIWSVYVQHQFGANGSNGLGNFTWPLLGLFTQMKHALHEIASGNFDSRYSFSLIAMLGLFTQIFVLWRSPHPHSPWWRVGAAYSILLFFLSYWVWSGYWAVCRAVLPMTVAFNLLLPANNRFWPLWISGNLTLLHGVWRFL